MAKPIKVRPVINKNNGQVNISFSRKKLPKDLLEEVESNSLSEWEVKFL